MATLQWFRRTALALVATGLVLAGFIAGCSNTPTETASTLDSNDETALTPDEQAHIDAIKLSSTQPYDESYLPPDLQLDYRWSLPLPYEQDGTLVNGWVIENMVLVESEVDRHHHVLTAIDRFSGDTKWVVGLSGAIEFTPTVTPGHVYLVVNNKIVSILRLDGKIRYVLDPIGDIAIACQPLVIEPDSFPESLSTTLVGTPLERIFLISLTGKMYGLQVSGRIRQYFQAYGDQPGYSAADYQLDYLDYFKPLIVGHVITPVVKQGDYFYITNDQNQLMVLNDQGQEQYRITAQDRILCTPVVTPAPDDGLYFGSFDTCLYKYAAGVNNRMWDIHTEKRIFGPLYLDLADLKNRYLMCPLEDGGVIGLSWYHQIIHTASGRERVDPDETVEVRFKVGDGLECLATSQNYAYIGTREDTTRKSVYDQLHSTGIVCVDKMTGEKKWKVDLPDDFLFPLVTPPRDRITQPAWIYFLTRTNHVIALSEYDPNNTHVQKRRLGHRVSKVISRETNEEVNEKVTLRRAIGHGSYYFDYNK
ncbi:MAG: hypothetical protein ACREJ2_07705 [Planctomycetota bacterium]